MSWFLTVLTPPVHRGGLPAHLRPEVDFYQGDTRNRDLLANLLRRVEAVFHFAAYQDYLPDFSRFSDVNVVSTALLDQSLSPTSGAQPRRRRVVPYAAMGEGLYCVRRTASRLACAQLAPLP